VDPMSPPHVMKDKIFMKLSRKVPGA